ncbi:MAG: hypothetical protein ACOCVW_03635 [bacterium]
MLITTDHRPASLLSSAGHPVIRTPTLDEVARSATRFTTAYSECPVSIPAPGTLMTGTPPALTDRPTRSVGTSPARSVS